MARAFKHEKWLEEDNLILIRGWKREGLSDEQVAHNMGIARSTLFNWREKYAPIREAIEESKEVTDYIVENELFKSCQTRTVTVRKPIKVRVEKSDGKKKIVEEKIEYIEEEQVIPANTAAQIFFLKNRRSKFWRDKPEITTNEVYEESGLLKALDAQVDNNADDDSWMIEQEEKPQEGKA